MSSEKKPEAKSVSASQLDAQMQQAWEHFNTGDYDQAARLFHSVIDLVESELGATSLETARILTDVSTGLFLLGEIYHDEAAGLFERVLKIQTATEGECNLGCGRLHRQLAVMHNTRKDFESAAVSYGKAVDIFEALEAVGSDVDAAEKDALYTALKKTLLKADEAREEDEALEPATKRLIHCDES